MIHSSTPLLISKSYVPPASYEVVNPYSSVSFFIPLFPPSYLSTHTYTIYLPSRRLYALHNPLYQWSKHGSYPPISSLSSISSISSLSSLSSPPAQKKRGKAFPSNIRRTVQAQPHIHHASTTYPSRIHHIPIMHQSHIHPASITHPSCIHHHASCARGPSASTSASA